ncbi:MAG: stage II sporulation protein D [Firmicutes bacterium]|nr:stage II sporulation protein D [Bacillota bacterium]
MRKTILSILVSVFASVLIIPVALSGIFYFASKNEVKMPFASGKTAYEDRIDVEKYINEQTYSEDDLEEYIVGVVAAEMPASFEKEALKAQSVAARTYAVNSRMSVDELIKSEGQAYNTIDEMKGKWGDNFAEYYQKIKTAVYETEGEIIVYNDEPILAVFHAISGGKTETAENIWQRELPYLKSVESSKDTMAKEYSAEKFFLDSEAAALLQSQFNGLKLTEGHIADQMQIFERTDAGYVSKIQIGNMVFSGRQVREALGLRSSNFSFSQKDDGVVFETKGYGHGAGMSQYGANYMAAEGRTYGEIIKHYYSGVEIKKYD